MARPHSQPPDRPPSRPPSRTGPGGRDYAAEYANRVRGVPKGQRQEVRGHRGQTAAFKRFIKEGDLILCDVRAVDRDPKKGIYKRIEKQVITGSGVRRRDRFFVLRDLTRRELEALIEFEIRRGVVFSPAPSLDQRRLIET